MREVPFFYNFSGKENPANNQAIAGLLAGLMTGMTFIHSFCHESRTEV